VYPDLPGSDRVRDSERVRSARGPVRGDPFGRLPRPGRTVRVEGDIAVRARATAHA